MSSWSDSSLYLINDWAKLIGIISLALALASGVLAYITDKEIAKRTSARPRTLSGAQRAALIEALAGTPREPVKVQAFSGDVEAYAFGVELLNLIREAGFEGKEQPEGFVSLGAPPTGVRLGCADIENPPGILLAIEQALKSAGIETTRLSQKGWTNENVFTVSVGIGA